MESDTCLNASECLVCGDNDLGYAYVWVEGKTRERRSYCFDCKVIVLEADDWLDPEDIEEFSLEQ